MMSQQFAVASALTKGEVSIDMVKIFDDPDINAMAKKVSVEVDAQIDKMGHETYAGTRRGYFKRRHCFK
jgi:2-methylcitrate dehydratase PrpD